MSVKSTIGPLCKTYMPTGVYQRVRSAYIGARARTQSRNLIALAQLFGTDKWGSHWYAQHYQRHLEPLRAKPIVLLEVGVGGYEDPHDGGQSLRVWKRFFPKGQIVGIDLYPKQSLEEDRIRIFQGSQDDPVFLDAVIEDIGHPDVIIDDGSHLNSHVIKTFDLLFPHLADRGIYVVEDTQTAYWPTWEGDAHDRNTPATSMGFFKGLIDGLNHSEFLAPIHSPSYFEKHIVAMHFYHNLIFIEKGLNDEVSNMVTGGILRST